MPEILQSFMWLHKINPPLVKPSSSEPDRLWFQPDGVYINSAQSASSPALAAARIIAHPRTKPASNGMVRSISHTWQRLYSQRRRSEFRPDRNRTSRFRFGSQMEPLKSRTNPRPIIFNPESAQFCDLTMILPVGPIRVSLKQTFSKTIQKCLMEVFRTCLCPAFICKNTDQL